MRKTITLLLVLILTASSIVLQPTKAESRTIIVPDDYATVQEAINYAKDDDTIFIKKGSYEGTYNQTLEINKVINLIGEDRDATILSLSPPLVPMSIFTYEYTGYLASILINSNNVKISGLTIDTPGGDVLGNGDRIQISSVTADTGLSIEGHQAIISENAIMGDLIILGSNNIVADNLFGMRAEGIAPTIDCVGSNNVIVNNTLATKNEGANIGLNIEGSNNLVVDNLLRSVHLQGDKNIVYRNIMKAVPGDCGVYLHHSSNNTICANRITYAESITYQQEGVMISESYDNRVYANHFESLFKGVYLQNTDTEPMVTNNNTFYHNNFIDNQIQAWDTTSSTTNAFDNSKEGNYWSDYNGVDANNDGIGDSPHKPTSLYVNGDVRKVTECGTDNYPLMTPFDIDSVDIEIPEWIIPSIDPSPTSSISNKNQQPTVNTGEMPPENELFPTTLVVGVLSIGIVAFASLLIYYRKRRSKVDRG